MPNSYRLHRDVNNNYNTFIVSECHSSWTALNLFLPEQAVDLSSNALTSILPIMTIALELPQLEADLADNQWQCDGRLAAFQTVMSESWKEKWNGICPKTIGKSVVPHLSERVPTELKKVHKTFSFI